MLDAPEKPIRIIQSQNFIGSEQIQFAKRSQRFKHARFLQERMPRSVDQLQRLHDEFDVADAATSKLHVATQFLSSHDISLDAMFDVRDFVE